MLNLIISNSTQVFGAFVRHAFGLVDTLVFGRVAFHAAASPGHRIKEDRVNVERTAGHPSSTIDQRAVHASLLNQETLAHKSWHVGILPHTRVNSVVHRQKNICHDFIRIIYTMPLW